MRRTPSESRGLSIVGEPTPTPGPLRALLLDDDEWALRLLHTLLMEACPDLHIETRSEPDCSGDFDLYFLDNDFNGQLWASEFARTIRERDPDALIVAFSGTLDRGTLVELLNAGCNGACDKSRPSDVETLLRITRRFVEARRQANQRRPQGQGVLGAIRSIGELLREWNSRLENCENRAAAAALPTHSDSPSANITEIAQ